MKDLPHGQTQYLVGGEPVATQELTFAQRAKAQGLFEGTLVTWLVRIEQQSAKITEQAAEIISLQAAWDSSFKQAMANGQKLTAANAVIERMQPEHMVARIKTLEIENASLQMYRPARRATTNAEPVKQIRPTDWKVWGIDDPKETLVKEKNE
jgi:hypothetical protein